jgi:hypothetical protein
MRNEYIEATKLAIYQQLENIGPNKGILMAEVGLYLPDGVSEEEFEASLDTLQKLFYIKIDERPDNPSFTLIGRGPSYPKWKNEIFAPPEKEEPQTVKVIKSLKNHPVILIFIVISGVLAWIASTTESIEKILNSIL